MEALSSNSEPVKLTITERNSGTPFLPEKTIDGEMIDRSREQDSMKVKKKRGRASFGVMIDRISRFLFPFAFISFNVLYWNHYLNK